MDWKTLGNIAALVGVLVAMVMMLNQVNGRIDRLQAGTNARFDMIFDRMDRMQAETNAWLDRMLAETNARFDAVLEAIMSFDRRVSRIEGRFDAQSAGTAE
jgi:uncharacterized protein YdcH (DUF465 family)